MVACEGNCDLCWKVEQPVSAGFYYVQVVKAVTKSSIGKFFLAIDPNFQHRISDRPSNVYMYVQRLALSSKPHSEPMSYGIERTVEKLQFVVKEYQSDFQEMSDMAATTLASNENPT